MLLWLTLWPLWCALLLAPAIMMSPGCGCCESICEHCQSGTRPTEITVRLAGWGGSGSYCSVNDCAAINGDFVVPTNDTCLWEQSYTILDTLCAQLGKLYIQLAFYADRVVLSVFIRDVWFGNVYNYTYFTKSLEAPYDCSIDIAGEYNLDTNQWTECEATSPTCEVIV